jgi:phosphatidylglycerophosphate synthase
MEAIMASPMVEFCEQSNPLVLVQAGRSRVEKADAKRVQQSFLAAAEKRALIWMAERTPEWVSPDHLTTLAFLAQVGAGVCFALAASNQMALLGVVACLAINWFGDSMDGTLARVRDKQRPRYGFYVDHMVDTFGAAALMGGLALSGFMHPAIAGGLLVAFLMLAIQSYLATYTIGEFHLSFWKFGPTEIRILLAVGALALLRWPMVVGGRYRLFDIGGVAAIVGMAAMLVWFTVKNGYRLYCQERV